MTYDHWKCTDPADDGAWEPVRCTVCAGTGYGVCDLSYPPREGYGYGEGWATIAQPVSEQARLYFKRTDSDYVPEDHNMEFRLTYEGQLKSDGSPKHKHEIRRAFHPQLRALWDMHPYLKTAPASVEASAGPNRKFERVNDSLREHHALSYARLGYNFVPLVTKDLSLSCGLDILFLRPSMPGEIMKSGDLDGRLKTLFDALRLPDTVGELGGYTTPQEDEKPFFVLLQDDKLITHISIRTDTLLQPTSPGAGVNDARLVIAINIQPVNMGWHNINFGGA